MPRTVRQTPAKGGARAEVGEISASKAAESLFMTKQAIGIWCARSGAPVRRVGVNVFVRWPDFMRWREQELVAGARKATPEGSFAERRAAAEARSAEIAMELRELELAEKQGAVVAVADYEAALGGVLDRLTARLRAMPVRLSHLGAEAEAAAEVEVERIVSEMHGFDEDVIEETDPTPERERAA